MLIYVAILRTLRPNGTSFIPLTGETVRVEPSFIFSNYRIEFITVKKLCVSKILETTTTRMQHLKARDRTHLSSV